MHVHVIHGEFVVVRDGDPAGTRNTQGTTPPAGPPTTAMQRNTLGWKFALNQDRSDLSLVHQQSLPGYRTINR